MSQRVMLYLLGVLAAGLSLLCRFGGLYAGWDAGLSSALHLTNAGHFQIWLEAICSVLFAFGTVIVALQVETSRFRIGLMLAILLQPISATAVGALAGVWISPYCWLVAIAAAWVGATGYRFSSLGKREALLRRIFGKNVSELTLTRLSEQPDAAAPTTALATVLSARFLGENWIRVEAVAQNLREQSAWVEVQTGNRLLAVWNVPLTLGNAHEMAVEASLEMTPDWQVGLATSEVKAELLNPNDQWQMRGACFDNADALCQGNATFGSSILIDLATADRVRDTILLRPVDFFTLPGTGLAAEIFEPLALARLASAETVARRDRFWEAVIYFRQKRFAEALAALQKAGDDALVSYYRNRLDHSTSSR